MTSFNFGYKQKNRPLLLKQQAVIIFNLENY